MAGVKGRSGGRNAKTIEQLKAEGTYDPSRHAGVENPLPVPGMPRPPGKLGKLGRREWRRTVELLESNLTLSRETAAALYHYCKLFEDTERIEADRAERRNSIERIEESMAELKGEALVDAIGNLAKLWQLEAKDNTQLRQYRLAIRTYLVEFGLTPAARSRVKLVPVRQRPKGNEPKDPTPLEKLQAAQRQLRAV